MIPVHETADGVSFAVKVQPRASRNAIGQPLGNELRVKGTAPPVDNAANEALIKLFARHFDCSRSQIELIRGNAARHKVLKLQGIALETIIARLTS